MSCTMGLRRAGGSIFACLELDGDLCENNPRMSYSPASEVSVMTQAAKNIVKAAVQLREKERVQVVEHLLASLEPEADKDVDAAWAAEVERRSQEVKQGLVHPVSWAAVNSKARKF